MRTSRGVSPFFVGFLVVWLLVVLGTVVGEIRDARSVSAGLREWWRNHARLGGRLAITGVVGYCGLTAYVAGRWGAVSVLMLVVPLVVIGAAGFRALGRQILAHKRAATGKGAATDTGTHTGTGTGRDRRHTSVG